MPLAMRKQRAQKTRTVVLLVLTILVIGSILEFITDCRKWSLLGLALTGLSLGFFGFFYFLDKSSNLIKKQIILVLFKCVLSLLSSFVWVTLGRSFHSSFPESKTIKIIFFLKSVDNISALLTSICMLLYLQHLSACLTHEPPFRWSSPGSKTI